MSQNPIDPIWYIKNGPLIIFPNELIPHLLIEDMVEYFRLYPDLNWKKYPKLYKMIVERLTPLEQRNLMKLTVNRRNYTHWIQIVKFWMVLFSKNIWRRLLVVTGILHS